MTIPETTAVELEAICIEELQLTSAREITGTRP